MYLKGAPEKVLDRCQNVLMRNEDGEIYSTAYDSRMQYNVKAANDRFGLMGERVLAFAKIDLEPADFPKNSFEFDTAGW